jgi:hypothetical protein
MRTRVKTKEEVLKTVTTHIGTVEALDAFIEREKIRLKNCPDCLNNLIKMKPLMVDAINRVGRFKAGG